MASEGRPDVAELEHALGILEAEAEAISGDDDTTEFESAVVTIGCRVHLRKDMETPDDVEVAPYV